MSWRTMMQLIRGILSGAGVIAGIAAVSCSSALGKRLAAFMDSGGDGAYGGIQSQAAQTASDQLQASLIFFDGARMLLLFGGVAMICLFGLILAGELRKLPVDVLVDSRGVEEVKDTLRRRVAAAAARLAGRLDPERNARVVHRQEVLPEAPAPLDLSGVETAEAEPVPAAQAEGEGTAEDAPQG